MDLSHSSSHPTSTIRPADHPKGREPSGSYNANDYGLTQAAYSVPDFGHQLGISRSTVFGMIREGRIATIRIANRTYIPTPAIVALLNGHFQPATNKVAA